MNLFSEPSLEDLCSPPPGRSPPVLYPPVSLAPSPSFDVYDVSLASCPHPAARSRPTAAQKQGLRYEARAKEFLGSIYPGFVDGPWLSYRRLSDHQRRFCQPDGYVLEGDRGLTIFEIKLRWCAEASSQLRLYRAALSVLYTGRNSRCVCVTRSFDPAVRFEGRAVFIEEPLGGATKDLQTIEVFIWK